MSDEIPSKPTFAELVDYCHRSRNCAVPRVDPQRFWDFAESRKWLNSKGKPNRNWQRFVDGHSQNTSLWYQNAEAIAKQSDKPKW